jgi:hypothetical protein
VKRNGYEWPQVTVVHPDHGAYLMDVHGLQAKNGHIVLMAFLGKDIPKQVRLVRSTSRDMGFPIVALEAADITEEIGLRLAAHFHTHPGFEVAVMEVES